MRIAAALVVAVLVGLLGLLVTDLSVPQPGPSNLVYRPAERPTLVDVATLARQQASMAPSLPTESKPRLASAFVPPVLEPFPDAPASSPAEFHALIQQEAARNGVDPVFVECIIQQESNFDPNATSYVGAMGLMQLMPETAADLGVQNAYDPAQNIAGGTRLIADLLAAYDGNHQLALAAYNAGPGAVDQYGGIPPYEETQNYVHIIYNDYLERVNHGA